MYNWNTTTVKIWPPITHIMKRFAKDDFMYHLTNTIYTVSCVEHTKVASVIFRHDVDILDWLIKNCWYSRERIFIDFCLYVQRFANKQWYLRLVLSNNFLDIYFFNRFMILWFSAIQIKLLRRYITLIKNVYNICVRLFGYPIDTYLRRCCSRQVLIKCICVSLP